MNIPNAHDRSDRQGFARKDFQRDRSRRGGPSFAEPENPKTNALLTISHDRALEAAKRVDQQIANGEADRAPWPACRSR